MVTSWIPHTLVRERAMNAAAVIDSTPQHVPQAYCARNGLFSPYTVLRLSEFAVLNLPKKSKQLDAEEVVSAAGWGYDLRRADSSCSKGRQEKSSYRMPPRQYTSASAENSPRAATWQRQHVISNPETPLMSKGLPEH